MRTGIKMMPWHSGMPSLPQAVKLMSSEQQTRSCSSALRVRAARAKTARSHASGASTLPLHPRFWYTFDNIHSEALALINRGMPFHMLYSHTAGECEHMTYSTLRESASSNKLNCSSRVGLTMQINSEERTSRRALSHSKRQLSHFISRRSGASSSS